MSLRRVPRSLRTFSTTPPAPQSLNQPRLPKYVRRSAYVLVGLGGAYVLDREYNASSIVRNLRTLQTCAMITLDYKWNFTPEKSEQIPQLHERVAQRVFDLLTSNGGLYIKIGQAIGANAALLPEPMQVKFASLFDDAPQIPYSVVRDVFIKELGRPPDGPNGVFAYFDPQAVASASIAQVHRARLHPQPGDDEDEEHWVAVKVQKPSVGTQMNWDLGAYRAVMWMFENWAFDLPVYFAVDFVSDHLRQELDFIREAENARKTAAFVASEPRLRDKVHIPRVYPEYSTRRVLVAEWIDGVRLSDKAGVKAMGHVKAVMQTMVELFAAQMFDWGWVHCDPHPGNVLIRPRPDNPALSQLVLLDHGLYVPVPDEFRTQWGLLWRAMLTGDYGGVEKITKQWGFGIPELLASFTLLRPTALKNNRKTKPGEEGKKPQEKKPMTQYEMSVRMKQKLKEFLADTDRMPKVLIFLTRNMRMVQGNNQSFGSPVNRIKITGLWASRSLARHPPPSTLGPSSHSLLASLSPHALRHRLHAWSEHFAFLTTLAILDVLFYRTRFLQWARDVGARISAMVGWGKWKKGNGLDFESELEKEMRGFARDNLGLDVSDKMFAG
ncbi:ABC1-domain-containing protein [Pholiota conissans]|uniref:ABC1-domain-containing protein n=1 Tax=Pholiota conissans TaxID=109636 RepID=A0A9P5YRD5_9AGAR|nr:ABC1-domain-containing protein [Pholiota conissans]